MTFFLFQIPWARYYYAFPSLSMESLSLPFLVAVAVLASWMKAALNKRVPKTVPLLALS